VASQNDAGAQNEMGSVGCTAQPADPPCWRLVGNKRSHARAAAIRPTVQQRLDQQHPNVAIDE
jgi:hypothetical protein